MKSDELLLVPSTYEIAVLSCCLNSEDGKINCFVGDAIAAGVRSEMFTEKRDQRLWELLIFLYHKNPSACNMLHVYDYCMTNGHMDQVGGEAHLRDVVDKCDLTFNFSEFLKNFLGHYARKASFKACQDHLAALLSDFTKDAYELNEDLTTKLHSMAKTERKKIIYSPSEFVDLMEEQIRAEACNDIRKMGFVSNMSEIDRCFPRGISNGSLVVIGAAPSVGKTVMGMNILAEACAVQKEKNVHGVFFSAEMLPADLASRGWKSALNTSQIIGRPESVVIQYCAAMRATMENSKLYAVDATGMTISNVISTARRLHASEPIKVMCFDYLQKLPTELAIFNREREVASWVSAFKQLATELECVVILLSQLNRSARNEKRYPVVSDLRDSGQIEQDADVIFLIDELRDNDGAIIDMSDSNLKPRWTRVAKNRNGAQGYPMMTLIADCFKFVPRTEVIKDE